MLVWLAIIKPLTLWAEARYGDRLDKATWMLAGPQGMKLASLRSLILCRLLCTYRANVFKNKRGQNENLCNFQADKSRYHTQSTLSYLRGVNFSLDDVEDSNVAVTGLSLSPSGHHHILWLQEPPHHIQHGCLPHTSDLRRSFVSPFKPISRCASRAAYFIHWNVRNYSPTGQWSAAYNQSWGSGDGEWEWGRQSGQWGRCSCSLGSVAS